MVSLDEELIWLLAKWIFNRLSIAADTLSSGVIIIEEKFSCKTVFKFVAINAVGESEMSSLFQFNQEKCKGKLRKKGSSHLKKVN